MKHPELKAHIVKTLTKKTNFLTEHIERIADAFMGNLPESIFTPTREQVLRWDGLPELLFDFCKAFHIDGPIDTAVEPIKQFISKQLSALTLEPESLIGREVRGFSFESGLDTDILYVPEMDSFIGVIGKVIEVQNGAVMIDFPLTHFWYPLSEIHAHLVDEPTPQTYPAKTAVGPVLTEEMAKRVYDRLLEMGKRNGAQQIGWGVYGVSTCYEIEEIRFGHINTYRSQGYHLITPEEFLGVEAEASVNQDLADLKRIVCEGQKLIDKLETK